MNTPAATVISVDRQTVTVKVDATVACSRCAAGKGCGAGLIGGDRGAREFALPMPPGMRLQQGETVVLQMLPTRLLQASFLAYGLPLACMLLLPALADWLFGPLNDAVLAGTALAGLVSALLLGRRYLAREPCLRRLTPDIAGRVGQP